MKKLLLILMLAFAGSPSITAAQEGARDLALTQAAARGRSIYRFDQAAWITTDELIRLIRDPGGAGVRGWIVEPDGDGLLVTYYGLEGDTPYAIFKAGVKDNKVVSSHIVAGSESRTLSPAGVQMIKARTAATAGGVASCARGRVNTVVLPPEPDGTTLVYVLTPQVRTGEFPMGGHSVIRVDAGGKVLTSRAFTKGCLPMTAPKNVAALYLTHLLDPQPTEIHVYLSLWIGKPVFVQIDGGTWEVDGTAITAIDPNKVRAR